LRFRVHDPNVETRCYGQIETCLDELLKKKEFVDSSGSTLTFSKVEIIKGYSFLEYLRSGWQISLVGAIDYTGSNATQGLHNVG
jgi:hypothetical protein